VAPNSFDVQEISQIFKELEGRKTSSTTTMVTWVPPKNVVVEDDYDRKTTPRPAPPQVTNAKKVDDDLDDFVINIIPSNSGS